jgi:hypothetical protein
MRADFIVSCPWCGKGCYAAIEDGDLEEGQTTEGFFSRCVICGCSFSFDVHVDTLNKTILGDGED